MRSILLSLTVMLAFAGTSFAQSTTAGAVKPAAKKAAATTNTKSTKVAATSNSKAAAPTAAKPAAQRASTARSAAPRATAQKRATAPQDLRGSRYGGFAPAPVPDLPPPTLDTTSPRSLSLVNFNTQEVLSVTYWSNGAYHRDALDKLNGFLRDSRDGGTTEMDPLVFDVLWHTMQIAGYSGTVEVLSAFRSPSSNAWLASVSRGVARDSQHMNGNAMDIRFPGAPVIRIRQAARALNMGGVGFYPRSGFVHLDTGPVRYW